MRNKGEIMCDEVKDQKCCCCNQGPQGVPGRQGEQGVQGVPGAQGIAGQQGVQGVQGLQGIPGVCECDCSSSVVWANVFSEVNQTLGQYSSPTDAVKFEGMNDVSPDIDVTQANITGEVKINKHGKYSVEIAIQGSLNPPFPSPVPSWGAALFLNGIKVPGSGIGGFSQSPDDDVECSAGEVIVEIKAGDKLMVRNILLSQGLFLKAIHPELAFPISSASMNIKILKELP